MTLTLILFMTLTPTLTLALTIESTYVITKIAHTLIISLSEMRATYYVCF